MRNWGLKRDLTYVAFLRQQIDANGRVDDGAPLPGDVPRNDNKPGFAPGALDGIVSHHMSAQADVLDVSALVRAILAAADHKRNDARLRAAVADVSLLEVIDDVCRDLVESQASAAKVRALGARLCLEARERNAAKLGLALLGLAGVQPHDEIVRTLGSHSEFTVYAVVALNRSHPRAEQEIWALAQRNEGWGRVHAVERLEGTEDPQIRHWILREGFKNGVMDEYLAYIAVETGGLVDQLEGGDQDASFYADVSRLMAAFLGGGPARDIRNYPRAQELLLAFVQAMESHATTVEDYHALSMVDHVVHDVTSGSQGSLPDFPVPVAEQLAERVAAIKSRPDWIRVAERALDSEDRAERWRAVGVLRACGGDPFPWLLRDIRADPVHGPWWAAWQHVTPEQAHELVDACVDLLDPRSLAVGAQDRTSFGPDYAAHRAVEWTLQALKEHIGLGPHLLEWGLSFPTLLARRQSIEALRLWADRPLALEQQVREMAVSDPSEYVRKEAAEAAAEWDGGAGSDSG